MCTHIPDQKRAKARRGRDGLSRLINFTAFDISSIEKTKALTSVVRGRYDTQEHTRANTTTKLQILSMGITEEVTAAGIISKPVPLYFLISGEVERLFGLDIIPYKRVTDICRKNKFHPSLILPISEPTADIIKAGPVLLQKARACSASSLVHPPLSYISAMAYAP